MAAQQQITVTASNGEAKVTDNNGNTLDWVNIVYIALDPGTTPILYLGCTNFSATLNTNPPTPAPTPSPSPTPTPAPTGT